MSITVAIVYIVNMCFKSYIEPIVANNSYFTATSLISKDTLKESWKGCPNTRIYNWQGMWSWFDEHTATVL